ncbi:MAG: hypothetical protein AAFZ65_06450 [Planctomycetota bacterium]
MANNLLIIFVPALAAGFASPVQAQVPAPVVPLSAGQGMWTGDAVGVQWQTVTLPSRLGVRDAGVSGAAVQPWTQERFGAGSIDHPDYSSRALFAHWVPGLFGQTAQQWSGADPRHNPILGGWSTGGDITPAVNAQGALQFGGIAPPAWYNLSFTVDEEAVGVAGSAVDQAVQNLGRASDHVFSYTADGSTGIRADYIHTVRFEYTGSQMGGITQDAELTALDWGMGLISETPGATGSRLQPTRNRLYFSLSQAWITAHSPAPLPGPIQAKSNEIYAMEWDGATWSEPAVAFSTTDLFGALQPAAELDAISVFSNGEVIGQEPTAVFSLTPSSFLIENNELLLPSQILVTQRGAYHPYGNEDATAETFSVQTGGSAAPLSTVVGLEVELTAATVPDNVTGLCGRDPKEGQWLDPFKGNPTDMAAPSNGVELSILRHFDTFKVQDSASVQETLRLTVSGVDELGFDIAYIEFFITTFAEENGNLQPLFVLPPLNTFGGAQDLLIEGVYPITLDTSAGQELRVEAVVTGLTVTPFGVVPAIASSGSCSLGIL